MWRFGAQSGWSVDLMLDLIGSRIDYALDPHGFMSIWGSLTSIHRPAHQTGARGARFSRVVVDLRPLKLVSAGAVRDLAGDSSICPRVSSLNGSGCRSSREFSAPATNLARTGEPIWLAWASKDFLAGRSELAKQSKVLLLYQTPILAGQSNTVPSKGTKHAHKSECNINNQDL